MKKNDWILAGVVLLAAALLAWMQQGSRQTGSRVLVTVDGQESGAYSLSQEQTVRIEGKNGYCLLQIKNGSASVTEADCPDRLCVRQHAVSKSGETIACLPGRILIRIEGGEDSGYDAVAK